MTRLKAMAGRLGGLPAKLKAPPKVAEQFYSSPEWRKLVGQRRRDPDYRTALRRALPGERLILDHIRERKDGGAPLDPANTQWLTNSEHQAKTAQARKRRARGQA